ncbi:major facilitator superfamily domain-containing protein [Xylariaceae sp. FL0016]|nr:major facilitator superfamily domain-containing protein [Xylariaceae sp. FL0016]
MSDKMDEALQKQALELTTAAAQVGAQPTKKGFRFWAVFTSLCITALLMAMETTVVSTALPHIVHDLQSHELYVWFANAFFLTCTAFTPLVGQLCDIFGRRWCTISVVVLFMLGSGISGGANSSAMLIAGRAVQGAGGGGINLCIELVMSDMLPVRERSKYMGGLWSVITLGTALGPFIGGAIVDSTTWRWVFYLNLPIGGVALLCHFVFLRVNYDRETSIWVRLKRIDYVGNLILMGSVAAVLLALSWGGTLYPWRSVKVMVPLLMGIVGLVAFHLYEGLPFVRDYPTLPERIFRRRTPAAALVISFIHFMFLYWIIYFLPIYFQAVLLQSPTISGVDLLPTVILAVATGVVAGAVLTKTGRYRPLHIASFALLTLGVGLFSRLGPHTRTAEWVLVQCVAALGLGLLTSCTLPAVQADLPEADAAAATAAFAFMRYYGSVWGVSVPAAIFNAAFAGEAWRIGDAGVRARLAGGNAYSFASAALVKALPAAVRAQVVDVYARCLQRVWYVAIGFALLGLLFCFVEKEIVLRTQLETEFGLEERDKGKGGNLGKDAEAGLRSGSETLILGVERRVEKLDEKLDEKADV